MERVLFELENCYGIRFLAGELDFSNQSTVAIYAPNGAMKTSLAATFRDIAHSRESRDRHFPSRKTVRVVTDERGSEIDSQAIVVVDPYDEGVGPTQKTSTLLVNSKLRLEYEELHADLDLSTEALVRALKKQSKTKKDVESELSFAISRHSDQFYKSLLRVHQEVIAASDATYKDVPFDLIFEERVVALLQKEDFKSALADYVARYNAVLDASQYFSRKTFSFYDASTIAKSLAEHGFFAAEHSVRLSGESPREITTLAQLEQLIEDEKRSITDDADLRKKFSAIEQQLTRNVAVRDFWGYVSENQWLLPDLANLEHLRQELWLSYLKANESLYTELVNQFHLAEKRKSEIEQAAAAERTLWEDVISIFNQRFYVPFTLEARNRVDVILGLENVLSLGFTFTDRDEAVDVERGALLAALSQGERRALYILNVLFEVEARKYGNDPTLFVIDDIADSFDYKNKYAIIRYLEDINDVEHFRQIILTHNFDFFRTLESRFVRYDHCYLATRSATGVSLEKANWVRNPFAIWKLHFHANRVQRLACVPFMRNLVEYTVGTESADYALLTSVVHWKPGSSAIMESGLDAVYARLFGVQGVWPIDGSVTDAIVAAATQCASKQENGTLEEKIVLSLGIRISAEKYMVTALGDNDLWATITGNQTSKLVEALRGSRKVDSSTFAILEDVLLMTPENIHLNSFMYEPILDMSDDHLKSLFRRVAALNAV